MNVSMSSVSTTGLSTLQGRSGPPPPPPGPPPDVGTGASKAQSTEDILTALDTDQSGTLTASEVADSPLSKFINADNWADVDTDGDGALNLSELQAHRETIDAPGGREIGLDGGISQADPISLFEGLLSSITSSGTATEQTATYAQELYTAMQNLLSSLEG